MRCSAIPVTANAAISGLMRTSPIRESENGSANPHVTPPRSRPSACAAATKSAVHASITPTTSNTMRLARSGEGACSLRAIHSADAAAAMTTRPFAESITRNAVPPMPSASANAPAVRESVAHAALVARTSGSADASSESTANPRRNSDTPSSSPPATIGRKSIALIVPAPLGQFPASTSTSATDASAVTTAFAIRARPRNAANALSAIAIAHQQSASATTCIGLCCAPRHTAPSTAVAASAKNRTAANRTPPTACVASPVDSATASRMPPRSGASR